MTSDYRSNNPLQILKFYLSLDDVEGDDAADLGHDGDDDGEEEEPDEARRLGGAAHPTDQPWEEQGKAQGYHDVGENLKKMFNH